MKHKTVIKHHNMGRMGRVRPDSHSSKANRKLDTQNQPLLRALRRFHATADAPPLTRFALHASKYVEVEFSNGSVFNLSAEFLRVHSPAVDAKIRSIAGEKVIAGRRLVGIMSAELVGNYGMRILFDDLHKTGIYSWGYLYHLGSNKFSLMRSYIKTLNKYGLRRDPPRRK